MTKYLYIGLAVACFALGLWVGRRGEVNKNTQTVEKSQVEVVKTETKEKVTRPDGTVIEKTVSETRQQETKKSDSTVAISEKSVQEKTRIGLIALLKSPLPDNILQKPVLGVAVERRLLDSPVWLGLHVYKDRSAALSLSLSF